MDIKPCGHRVVVRPSTLDEYDEVFNSAKKAGIALPEDHMEMKRQQNAVDSGKVVAIGPSAFADEEPWVKVGQTVYFAKYSGKAVVRDGVRYLVMNDDDLLCTVGDVNE